MADGIYSALTGAVANLGTLDTLANNLANADSLGFKEDRPLFQEVLRSAAVRPRSEAQVAIRAMSVDLSQGALQRTGNPFDLALVGEGFFAVSTPNGVRYTRRGDFRVAETGELRSSSGAAVLGRNGPIRLPAGDAQVDELGNIQVGGRVVDQVRIVALPASALAKEGDSLFSSAAAASPSQAKVMAGHLERSNVSPVGAMTQMIVASRAFEIALQAIQNHRQMDERLITESGRGG
jgi:flagellar basal-body rod protein FlgF